MRLGRVEEKPSLAYEGERPFTVNVAVRGRWQKLNSDRAASNAMSSHSMVRRRTYVERTNFDIACWTRPGTSKQDSEVVSEGSNVPAILRHHSGGRGGTSSPSSGTPSTSSTFGATRTLLGVWLIMA
jgi:hypothetical protein